MKLRNPSARNTQGRKRVKRAHVAVRGGTKKMPADARRDAILLAFVQETASAGCTANASLRAIAQRAGCTTPMIYRLFESRLGLVRAAVQWTYGKLLERLEMAVRLDALSYEQRLRAIADYVGGRPLGDQEVFEAILGLESRSDRDIAAEVHGVFERIHGRLSELIQGGVAAGEFRAETDPSYIAWRLTGFGLLDSQLFLLGLEAPRAQGVLRREFDELLAQILR